MQYRRSIAVLSLIVGAWALLVACGPTQHPEYSTWTDNRTAPPHLRVTWLEDPAHEMVVSWTTRGSEDNAVYYDTEPRHGELDAYAHRTDAELNGAYGGVEPTYHHTLLSDLEPSTTYYFTVVSDGRVSTEFHVVTAPADDASFKLLSGGDSRSNRANRRAMNRRISTIFEEDPEILALVHGGDYVVDGKQWELWNHWLEDHQLTTTSEGRVLPIIPVRGNHESSGPLFDEVFGFPGGVKKDYFRTKLGDGVTLLTLDTNTALTGDQRDWLAAELADARDSRWLLTSYHRPAFPAVKSSGPARDHWVPLFEQYDVDLVLESDGHALKRTVPIRDDQYDPTGVTYVGEGGLGVGQRSPKDRWYLDRPGYAESAHHVQLLEFGRDRLGYRAIGGDGTILDMHTLEPRER